MSFTDCLVVQVTMRHVIRQTSAIAIGPLYGLPSSFTGHRPYVRASAGYIGSFQPTRTSQALTGHAVKKPRIMESCIIIQYAAVVFGSPGENRTSW